MKELIAALLKVFTLVKSAGLFFDDKSGQIEALITRLSQYDKVVLVSDMLKLVQDLTLCAEYFGQYADTFSKMGNPHHKASALGFSLVAARTVVQAKANLERLKAFHLN